MKKCLHIWEYIKLFLFLMSMNTDNNNRPLAEVFGFLLGVCSLNHKDKPVIICPIRFREDWKIAIALEQIAKFETGSITDFTQLLQKKLDAKHSGVSDIDCLENVVVE
jgi:hypothetical protein